MQREAWFEDQPDLEPHTLVFIDETSANTKMARLHGRGLRGERLRAPIPHGHWKTTTFVGALTTLGMTAPMVLDGPMTSEWFLAYTRQVLVPTLHRGDVVILDNLPAHKGDDVRKAVEGPGATIHSFRPITRFQSDRERLFKAQEPAAKGRGQNGRRPLARHRRLHGRIHTRRIPKLLRALRI
jgi:transposase